MPPKRNGVWIFNGADAYFPAAVFSSRAKAEAWIRKHQGVAGTLTQMFVDDPAYERAIRLGQFEPKGVRERSARFVQKFTSRDDHYHYNMLGKPE